jgi:hypothetical protein
MASLKEARPGIRPWRSSSSCPAYLIKYWDYDLLYTTRSLRQRSRIEAPVMPNPMSIIAHVVGCGAWPWFKRSEER